MIQNSNMSRTRIVVATYRLTFPPWGIISLKQGWIRFLSYIDHDAIRSISFPPPAATRLTRGKSRRRATICNCLKIPGYLDTAEYLLQMTAKSYRLDRSFSKRNDLYLGRIKWDKMLRCIGLVYGWSPSWRCLDNKHDSHSRIAHEIPGIYGRSYFNLCILKFCEENAVTGNIPL